MLYQLLHPVYDRDPVFEDHVVAEINFFYWDRVKGANFIPHIGIRFLTPRLSIEGKLSLCMSWLHKKPILMAMKNGLLPHQLGSPIILTNIEAR